MFVVGRRLKLVPTDFRKFLQQLQWRLNVFLMLWLIYKILQMR